MDKKEYDPLNMNISIYSDCDVDVNFYRELKNSNPYLRGSNITIYYNDLYDTYFMYFIFKFIFV